MQKSTKIEILILTVITLILYWPTLHFDFVNFDDQVYVLQNEFIQNPSFFNLLDGSGTGNFHPLTMLSLALDNAIGKGDPGIFHFTSLLLHLINSVLVWLLVHRLFPNKTGLAFMVALLFAIHPMHIESVAWISSRKDVMYTFFYLLSMLAFLKFLDSNTKKFLYYAMIFGALSLLSKPAAITLPIALLGMDYFRNNKLSWKQIIRVIPLTIGSIIIGLLTISLQKEDAINTLDAYSILDRIQFAFYGISYYFTHGFIPSHLNAMHPYPSELGMTDSSFLLQVGLGLLMVVLGGYYSLKNKAFGFGFVFFLLHLILVLQLVSIGRAIVSERYTYVAYIGLFIAMGTGIHQITPIKLQKKVLYVLAIGIGLPMIIVSFKQIPVWTNSETLWTKVIANHPNDWYAYIGRGNYYRDSQQYPQAITDYQNALKVAPKQFENYFNLGDLQHALGKSTEAIETYSKAIQLNPNYSQAYANRGQFYSETNQVQKALNDFNQALALDPENYLGYNNRGNLYLAMGQTEQSISDFSRCLEIQPDFEQAWFNRATAQINTNPKQAIADFNKAIELNPEYIDAYNNLGSLYYQIGNYASASSAFISAIEIQPEMASIWLNLSIAQNAMGEYSHALFNAKEAKRLGANVPDNYIQDLQSK